MVHHKKKLIYLHIPRTGGHTVERVLGGGPPDHGDKNYYLKRCGQEIWDTYFKFASVRNPWDRWVSVYSYSKPYKKTNDLDFSNWTKLKFENYKKKGILDTQWPHLYFPQTKWLLENGVSIVDDIVRVENFKEDLERVLNIKIDQMPHQHRSHHCPYYEYYDKETADMVAEIYKNDIEYLGYKLN